MTTTLMRRGSPAWSESAPALAGVDRSRTAAAARIAALLTVVEATATPLTLRTAAGRGHQPGRGDTSTQRARGIGMLTDDLWLAAHRGGCGVTQR